MGFQQIFPLSESTEPNICGAEALCYGVLLRGETGRAGFKTPLEGEAMEVLGCFWAPKMLVLQSNKGKFRHQTWQSDLNSFLVVQTFKTQ
jgi:hypothetical protein